MRRIDQTCKQMAMAVVLVSGTLVLVPTAASAQFDIGGITGSALMQLHRYGGYRSGYSSSHHSKTHESSKRDSSDKDKNKNKDKDASDQQSSDQDAKAAEELYQAGKYSEAIPLAQRALAIREKSLGRDHPDVAYSLNYLAVLYGNQGRYADAEPLYKRSLAIWEKSLGRDHPYVALSLNNLAVLYGKQGRYADAEPLHKRSLAIREKALGRDHPDVAQSLDNLAVLYRNQGRYADAEPLYKRSLAIREKALGRDHPDVALSLNNLAVLYRSQGRYADAEPLYKRSLAIWEKSLGPDHPDVAQSLYNLAALYSDQGRYADAEPLYKRSLAIREKSLGPDHPDVARSLNNLAVLYVTQGRYADAEPLYKRSLAIQEKSLGRDHPDVAYSLTNLAVLYRSQGRYADAEPLYKRSLAIREKALGRDHPEVAESLNLLATLYGDQGRYADAEPLYKRSLAIREKSLGRDHPDVAYSLTNLAALYGDQGRYADAEPLEKRSLAIWEKALGPDHPDVAQSLNNLAVLYSDQGRYADAEPLYKRSLAIREKALGRDHPEVARSLNNLAVLYGNQGRYADALPLVFRTISDKVAKTSAALPVLLGAQADKLIPGDEAFDDSLNVVQRASQTSAGEALNALAVRFSAGSDRLATLVRKDQDLTAEDNGLDKAIVAAVSKEPSKRNAGAEQRIRDRIAAIANERGDLENVLTKEFPDYAALSKPLPLSIKEIQQLLGDDEALLVFDFDAKSYAWIVTKTDADWVELKISATDLNAQVKALRASLTFEVDKPFDRKLAFSIYQATFGTFANKIASKARLSIVTNGALTSLPPALLVTNDPAGQPLKDVDWLLRSHAITVLPSVASLKVLRSGSQTSSAAQKPMIAFADPVFSKAEKTQVTELRSVPGFYRGGQLDLAGLSQALRRLPETADEVRAIAAVLKADKNDLKLGTAASVTTVKQSKLDDYRIVYFATHGLVAGDVELFSKAKAEPALALTIPEQPTDLDDGLLTASEVAQLKLNADWVVLSACNTAAEQKPGAEALSGLARAFFYAGARSLVVSHWEVNSRATVPLMVGMFLASSRDPKLSHAQALRRSMLAMIDDATSDADAHPRLWAPFVVVGEPAKMQ
jgi:CHAT domain-containing protein/tetratricopeptide (TPR) repeat protein